MAGNSTTVGRAGGAKGRSSTSSTTTSSTSKRRKINSRNSCPPRPNQKTLDGYFGFATPSATGSPSESTIPSPIDVEESPAPSVVPEENVENDDGEEVDDETDSVPWWANRKPYYQRVFEEAIAVVMEGEAHLLCEEEQRIIAVYTALNVEAQKLFVRLFSRDRKWIRLSNLKYREIDLGVAYERLSIEAPELAEYEPEGLQVMLEILTGAELKTLVKESQIASPGASQTKAACVTAILAHTTGQALLIGDPLRRMTKRVREALGPVLRLTEPIVDLFERIMVIHFRSLDLLERPMTAGILSEVEKWVFPTYTVDRNNDIFKTREDAVAYYEALVLQSKIEKMAENRQSAETLEFLPSVEQRWTEIAGTETPLEGSQYFLQQFTAGRVHTRILTMYALDILPFIKQHEKAISILHSLLFQSTYGRGSRGKWWDQLSHLTLNYGGPTAEQRQEYALEYCVEAVRDPLVKGGYLVKIRRRLERIARKVWDRTFGADGGSENSPCDGVQPKKRAKKGKHAKMMNGWEEIIPGDIRNRLVDLTVKEPTLVVVEGNKVDGGATGLKSRWIESVPPEDLQAQTEVDGKSQSPESALMTVEEVAIRHYALAGYSGQHLENALLQHLFGLLFHSILYTPVPNVFQTRFQIFPLDLYTDAFADPSGPRAAALASRCEEIAGWTSEELVEEVMRIDGELRGRKVRAVGVAWNAVADPEVLESLVGCMRPEAVAAVMRGMADGYREHTGGLPDLVVWREDEVEADEATMGNYEASSGQMDGASASKRQPARRERSGVIKLVEVKGPGDRLSEKQIMWMDVLAASGWDVELCKVVDAATVKRTRGKQAR
ncbi:uncharacterized protein EV422DRAFT_43667 [Fimicolochytrium jonesii]|uniref:uncharacterized protein n=1 Tax=Fimicolochytrium jonesii TaxID=1396493 RepID=UPI0022FE0C6B|nr:uncharacterized protein EV422DRAFT_43667 [Fimicolochytrium jonesii]KAI8821465.1 hypothetical protein EV422DRAFT_43667 [Fimicolochytrium jonesii]